MKPFAGGHDRFSWRGARGLRALAAHDPEVAAVMNRFCAGWVDLATANLLESNPELGLRRAQRRALLIISIVDGLSLFYGAIGIDLPRRAGSSARCASW
jgi:hypothetical protein